jgi:hypothetical protein
VSRLYDRVLENGCEPLRYYDFFRAIGKEREYFDLGAKYMTDRFRNRCRDLFPDWDDALVRREWDDGMREHRASDVLSVPGILDTPVIAADEVAEYCETLPLRADFVDLVDIVVPPFSRLWVEARGPNGIHAHAYAVLFEEVDDWPTFESDWPICDPSAEAMPNAADIGWVVKGTVVCEWVKGRPQGPASTFWIAVGRDGRWLPRPDGGVWFLQLEPNAEPPPLGEVRDWIVRSLMGHVFGPMLFAISLMHCKNVHVQPVDPPERLSRKHERKHGHPLTRYHVLEIAPMRRILDTEGEAQTKGLGHALHICRGHFKTFTEDAPLFGRHVGTYWWPAQVRGSAEDSVVEKDYRIRLNGHGIGQTYRQTDENVTVAPAEVKPDDPDTSQRGLRAHNRTQNLLADAVAAAGFAPRSPASGEPDFDLAWEEGDTVWVAEVKSTTEKNEEWQMRHAIGQVIVYRQRLSDNGRLDVRTMIAIENAPFDESWIDLCGREGIALVWPEVMAQALGRT